MPEDIAPVEIDTTSEEVTPEEVEVIEEVVEAQLSDVCAQMLERLDILEGKVSELHAATNGYATTEHTHEQREPAITRESDERPASGHPYFRRLGE